jgi:hypothetical protein
VSDTFGKIPTYSEEWGEGFIEAMRDYMGALERSIDYESEENGQEVETISGQPFCGCTDCYERESYLMAIKLTVEGYEAGLVKLE